MILALLTDVTRVLLPSRWVAAAVGGALVGAGATHTILRWPRLAFENVGDGFSRFNALGQAYWIADPYGSPIPPFELRTPYYLVAHAAPMNDPDVDSSWRALAPDGQVLAWEVTYTQAMRAAQRHYLCRWLRLTLGLAGTSAHPLTYDPPIVPSQSAAEIDASGDIPF